MATTRSRKIRRKIGRDVLEMVSLILFDYETSPRHALRDCHETFGRQAFDSALTHYLHRNPIRRALRLAIISCTVEEQHGQSVRVYETVGISKPVNPGQRSAELRHGS